MSKLVYSVTDLNRQVKSLLENNFERSLSVRGELSEYRLSGGHAYFSLKDSHSTIRVVMWRSYVESLTYLPKVGDQVIVTASMSVYLERGTYQLSATSLRLEGQGDKLLALLLLKEKLYQEGLFDQSHKKTLKEYNQRIILVSADHSAAKADLISNIYRRFPLVEITFIPAIMQGKAAPRSVIQALQLADQAQGDVIILSRGGGSLDDLDAFNDEGVVREIFRMKTPLVTAIGHEINLSLADLVSDYHVSTPTAAAELVTLDQEVILKSLTDYQQLLDESLKNKLIHYQNKLDLLDKNLNEGYQKVFQTKESNINAFILLLKERLMSRVKQYQTKLEHLKDNLFGELTNRLMTKEYALKNLSARLFDLSPLEVLNRGYSITLDDHNQVIRDLTQVRVGAKIKTKLKNNSIMSIVKEIN